jgi:hypothetical protein
MNSELFYQEDNGAVYVRIDGVLRHILNYETFSNLFEGPISPDQYTKFVNQSSAPFEIGTPIMDGAQLINHSEDGKVYLTDIYPWSENQDIIVYRHIINPDQFNQIGFSWNKIETKDTIGSVGVPVSVESGDNLNIVFHVAAYYNIYGVFAYAEKLNPKFESIYKRYAIGVNNLPAIKAEIIKWQGKMDGLGA